MQKAEPQQANVQSQLAAKQKFAVESPQTEEVSQLEAMLESSPQAQHLSGLATMMNAGPAMTAQRKIIDMIHNNPHQAAQRKLIEGIHNSPRQLAQQKFFNGIYSSPVQVAQCKKMESLFGTAQRVEEEPVQGKFAAESPAQLEQQPAAKPNNTSLPDNLKSGIENLSGMSMDNVKVHYNSSQPAQLNALAYAQGTDIHVAPGQEQHLPHEAWHVVQQAQGRVKPTMQMKDGVPVNDDQGLEREADLMGGRALQMMRGAQAKPALVVAQPVQLNIGQEIVQCLTGYEIETNIPVFGPHNDASGGLTEQGTKGFTANIGQFLSGGLKYGMNYGEDPEGRFQISSDHNQLQQLHRKLVDKLLLLGLLKEGWQHRSLANIEYITPPRDELSAGSIGEHEADISAVKKHLNSALSAATGNNKQAVPPPAYNIYTGIPVEDLLQWVKANDIDQGVVKPDIDALAAACDNQVYIQETSGVLPEDIPSLYKAASKAMMETESPAKSTQIMANLMDESIAIGADAFAITGKLPEAYLQHKNAVVGFLTLLSTYALADYLSFLKFYSESKSTSKNLLPFMSKTKLHEAVGALPVEVRPNTDSEDDPWMSFTGKLEELSKKLDTKYWSDKYEMPVDEKKTKGSVFPNGIDLEMLNLIVGSALNVGAATGRPLSLDNPHPDVEKFSGQKAIPLEDRYFGQKHTEPLDSKNMGRALSDRFKFAADLQLGHLPEENDIREKAIEAIKTPLNLPQKVAEYVKLIEGKLGVTLEDNDQVKVWKQNIESAKLADAPEKQMEQLGQVNVKVHAELAKLEEKKNKYINENKDKDSTLTYAESSERVAKDIDYEFGSVLAAFNKKNLKAEHMKNGEDQLELGKLINEVDKTRLLYLLAKANHFNVMTKDTEPQMRQKVMKMMRSLIMKVTQKTLAAVEYYNAKPKV